MLASGDCLDHRKRLEPVDAVSQPQSDESLAEGHYGAEQDTVRVELRTLESRTGRIDGCDSQGWLPLAHHALPEGSERRPCLSGTHYDDDSHYPEYERDDVCRDDFRWHLLHLQLLHPDALHSFRPLPPREEIL